MASWIMIGYEDCRIPEAGMLTRYDLPCGLLDKAVWAYL